MRLLAMPRPRQLRPTNLHPNSLSRLHEAYTGIRYFSLSDSSRSAVLKQLKRVSELQQRVRADNSNTAKQRIIAEYPDLKALLEQVYNPKFRTHLGAASLETYLSTPSPPKQPISPPSAISELFDQLSSRAVTGNTAKELVRSFLIQHGIISEQGEGGDEEALAVFKRLLDRNLVAGFGARTLSEVQWGHHPTGPAEQSIQSTADQTVPPSPEIITSASVNNKQSSSLDKFACALGKTILAPDLPSLFSPVSPRWYASRKLDGVRVITYLDFSLPANSTTQPRLVDIQHLSRAGNTFTSLGNLRGQLEVIEEYPGLRGILEKDKEVEKGIRRLVLDGEVCVMRPISESMPPKHLDGIVQADSHPLWSGEEDMVQDFPATVSEIRRSKHTISHPGYYLFDLLSWSEFSSKGKGERRLFSSRMEELRSLGDWMKENLERTGVKNGVKVLGQVQVGKVEEVEGMIKTAAERGWEGLVLRADRPYKGSRSPDVRKFKQWLDAEHTVKEVEISRQRLAIDGVFDEYDAVAALVVSHKGHPVAVGSGLTARQRVDWAKEPGLIIGKQITVEYFSESEALGRGGVTSLRFPRIKTIWDGKRDI